MLGQTAPWILLTLLALASCATRTAPSPQPAAPASIANTPAEDPNPRLAAEPAPRATLEATPPQIATEPAKPGEPNPYIAPLLRQVGDLTIEAPPREPSPSHGGGRLRTHTEGSLSKGSPRVWVGPQVPGFVPLMEDSMELFLLDRVGDEFMALYRDPYGASSCGLGDDANCSYFVRLYDLEGNERWAVDPNELLSRTTYLEVQDIRYDQGLLYLNEACQSYARGARGKCSALLAYDPAAGELRWRTRPLVSNGEFLVHGDHIITGYGFTNERDFIFVIRRRDGKIVQKISVPKSPQTFTLSDDGLLEVIIYPGTTLLYRLRGWDSDAPRLVKTKRKPTPKRIITGRP